jgi:hypothetical protein
VRTATGVIPPGQSPDEVFYYIEFPFPVADRFLSVTAQSSGSVATGALTGVNVGYQDAFTITVKIFFIDDQEGARANFHVIVF